MRSTTVAWAYNCGPIPGVLVPVVLKKQWPRGSTFEGQRGRIAMEFRGMEGRALCKWGDAGFGSLVRDGKRNGLTPVFTTKRPV